jgi:hypothetical protein
MRASAPTVKAQTPTTATAKAAATKPTPAQAVLVAAVKTAFEKATDGASGTIFKGEKKASLASLPPAARVAYKGYERTTKQGLINNGPPFAKVAEVNGQKVFVVGGDLSDSGSEVGFYDAKGALLARAYSGQGEHPNANGVDWAS